MSRVIVTPGVCGLITTIESSVDDSFEATLAIRSECTLVTGLSEMLYHVPVLKEMRAPMAETTVYRTASTCRLHTACPVPSAILKAMEVAAGLALPADVQMTIEA